MKKTLLIVIVVALLVGGGAFWGGMKYANSKNSRNGSLQRNLSNLMPEQRQQRMAQFGARVGNGQNGGSFVSGDIISKDDKSITVKLPDGGSKIIFFSDSTQIMKSTKGDPKDLENGKTVMANGKANSDGSINAETIQVRPENVKP
ncbi:MAG: hypothetical protein AB1465_05210 [Patescibacteria group bacterium]